MQKKEGEAVINEMFEAGAHFGYSRTRRHPSVASYILGTKNTSDLINLEKTGGLLDEAVEFVKSLGAQKKQLLFVGTKPEAQSIMKELSLSIDMPFVSERWIGGTITNFVEIKKRITELEDLKAKREKGELEKYTKKEQKLIGEKIAKLERFYSGLSPLKKAPDALFIIDSKKEHIAATEASKAGIPIIALTNSDSNIKVVEYPIVANDASTSSIEFFAKKITKAYKDGLASKAE